MLCWTKSEERWRDKALIMKVQSERKDIPR